MRAEEDLFQRKLTLEASIILNSCFGRFQQKKTLLICLKFLHKGSKLAAEKTKKFGLQDLVSAYFFNQKFHVVF